MNVAEKWKIVATIKAALDGFDHIPRMELNPKIVEEVRTRIQRWVTNEEPDSVRNFYSVCEILQVAPNDLRRALRL